MLAKEASQWRIEARPELQQIRNRIREVVERLSFQLCPGRDLIELTLGDPTRCGDLPPHPDVPQAVSEVVLAGGNNGYQTARGSLEARQAIADKHTTPEGPLHAENVFLTNGCSEAIHFSLRALLAPGQNLLAPCPGFGLYRTICTSLGVEVRLYRLDPARCYEVDLEDLESRIDGQTGAILINNPSNPCGAVYSRQHLTDILAIAERHRLPIVADEVYAGMTFSGHTFHPLGALSRSVPVLSCGSLAKRWLVPGWRLGWILVHNKGQVLSESVSTSLDKLSTLVLGPCSLIQAALPKIMSVPQSWHDDVMRQIESTALTCYSALLSAPGLTPIKPQGAMYIMVEIDFSKFPSAPDLPQFVQLLCKETSVKLLPGSCFEVESAVRIVTAEKREKMQEACERICEFCNRHYTA